MLIFRPLLLLVEWWGDLTPWLRIGVPLVLIAISTALFFVGKIWIWGWALGLVLILFCGKTDSEKKGYHF